MISQTETAGANQYGFYAVPKALEPKKKYRENVEDEYEDEGQEQDDENPYATIEDRLPANQKQLQRDYYVDQAPYPEFKPRERGLDYGVQIERGDLFDFNLEVRPLIEILVGRTVVSAINELQQEKEKDERIKNLDRYQKKRNAELMVTQRLQAKHKRKLQETERRKLQKQIYIKNQKQAGKKIIARRNAKQCLLGMKNEIFNELEDQGYLRSEPISDLKIKYEQWLYEKIMEALSFQKASQQVVKRMVVEEEKHLTEEHRKFIAEEMARRQGILNERERIRRETAERKEKKRIKKMRRKLNEQRQQEFFKFDDLMQHNEQIKDLLKFIDRSNGFTNDYANRPSVYISGGIDNFILALLQSFGKELSAEEIQLLLTKILLESGRQLEFSLLGAHYDKLQEVKRRMEEEKIQFMRDKESQVKVLTQQLALDMSLLEATSISIKSKLHNNFIQAILNIYLTAQPEQTEENAFELNQQDKKRLQLKDKLIIIKQEQNFIQRLQKIDRILRVHFGVLRSEASSQAIKTEPKQQQIQKQQQEWIDIYDGQGWLKRKDQGKRQLNRSQQTAINYALTGFQNSFVFDQRTLYFLQAQLEKLLEIAGGQRFKNYCQNLGNIKGKLKRDVAVFDSEVRWA